jgi:hypothetical protein
MDTPGWPINHTLGLAFDLEADAAGPRVTDRVVDLDTVVVLDGVAEGGPHTHGRGGAGEGGGGLVPLRDLLPLRDAVAVGDLARDCDALRVGGGHTHDADADADADRDTDRVRDAVRDRDLVAPVTLSDKGEVVGEGVRFTEP